LLAWQAEDQIRTVQSFWKTKEEKKEEKKSEAANTGH
jgi:hypothetical protein